MLSKKELEQLTLEELKTLNKTIEVIIADKRGKEIQKVIYQHDCYGILNLHLRKYKHWAKHLVGIDDTKQNGYAFKGEFLNVNKKQLVPVGTLIVEVCDCTMKLYKVVADEEKNLILEKRSSDIIYFIREVKEYLELNKN